VTAVIASCACGWSAPSDTRPGAVIAGEAHLLMMGIDGHLVTIGGTR
jgi:hypothetical protein